MSELIRVLELALWFWSSCVHLHEVGSVFVDEGAESQAVPERRGHVRDGNIPVALTLDPAPLLQSLHGRHPGAQSKRTEPSRAEPSRRVGARQIRSGAPKYFPPPLFTSHRQMDNSSNFSQRLGHAGSRKPGRDPVRFGCLSRLLSSDSWKFPGSDTWRGVGGVQLSETTLPAWCHIHAAGPPGAHIGF